MLMMMLMMMMMFFIHFAPHSRGHLESNTPIFGDPLARNLFDWSTTKKSRRKCWHMFLFCEICWICFTWYRKCFGSFWYTLVPLQSTWGMLQPSFHQTCYKWHVVDQIRTNQSLAVPQNKSAWAETTASERICSSTVIQCMTVYIHIDRHI
jgi:hypothetical protein